MNAAPGRLQIVSTPIGNLEDITIRALRVLREADVVAAEDTRHTALLFSHYGIKTKLVSYHIYNEHSRTAQLLDEVERGLTVALVSDAGTPGIADPGFLLVREAVKRGIEPEIIPGVSALTFAAVASALPLDRFAFYGFAPVKSGRKRAFFEAIRDENKSCFVYESPHRLLKTVELIAEIMGGAVRLAVIKEATKIHEEVLRGSAADIAAELGRRPAVKGEYVIAVCRTGDDDAAAEISGAD